MNIHYLSPTIENTMFTPGAHITASFGSIYEYTHNENGLKVLLVPKPGSGVTAMMRVIHAGSKDENKLTGEGVAHFIEHMSFRQDGGAIWKVAGKINAETDSDTTRYYVICRSVDLPNTLKIDASRMSQAAVDVANIPTERSAVLNELERGEQAAQKMFRMGSAISILEHPYHHDTIGTRDDLMATDGSEMEKFRSTFYIPNNATLILVGDFEPNDALKHVHQTYGAIPKGAEVAHDYTEEPLQCGKRVIQMNTDAPCGMLCLTYRTPKGNTKEALALHLMSVMAWHNEQGRAASLIESGAVHDVGVYAPRQNQPYLWYTHATLPSATASVHQKAADAMHSMVQTFQKRIPNDELDRAKNTVRLQWSRSTESLEGIMNVIGRAVSMGDFKDLEYRTAALDSIDSALIQRVATSVFQDNNLTVVHVSPAKNPELLATEPISSSTHLEKAPEPGHIEVSSETSSLKCTKFEVPRRPSSVLRHVYNSDAAYNRVSVSFRVPPAQHEVATILAECLNHKDCTAPGVVRKYSAGHEYFHLNGDFSAEPAKWEAGLQGALQQEWLKAKIDSATINLQKSRCIAELNSQRGNQEYLAKQAFIRSIYETSPYHEDISNKVSRMSSVSHGSLMGLHSQLTQRPAVITVLSNSQETPVNSLVSLMGKDDSEVATESWTASARAPKHFRVTCRDAGSDMILMGQTVDMRPHTKEYAALQVAAYVLGGGMTGMLMSTIRGKQGLGTYGIYASLQTPTPSSDPMFVIKGTFTPSVCLKGIASTKQVLSEWHNGVTEAQFADAKNRIQSERAIDMIDPDSVSSAFHDLSLQGKDPMKAWSTSEALLASVSLEDVRAAMSKIDLQKMVTVVSSEHPDTMSVDDDSDED